MVRIPQPFFHAGSHFYEEAWLLFLQLTLQPFFHAGWRSFAVAQLLFVPLILQLTHDVCFVDALASLPLSELLSWLCS